MAEDAEGPEVAEVTLCGLAVDIPVAASALPGGHRPRDGFFRIDQPPGSEVGALAPLPCTDGADMVELEELLEATEDDEF